jgi:hypothetical protein
LTQNVLLDMIINATDIGGENIMFDLMTLCSISTTNKHSNGKFGVGAAVRQEYYPEAAY